MFKILRPNVAYMRQYNIPTLLRIMACSLFDAEPLSEPMLPYCALDLKKHMSVRFYLRFWSFHSEKCTWKCRLPEWRPCCPGGNKLIISKIICSFVVIIASVQGLLPSGIIAFQPQFFVLRPSLRILGPSGCHRYRYVLCYFHFPKLHDRCSVLTHWGRDKMDAISQTTFSNEFLIKMFKFPLKLHWSLFTRVQLTIFQQWFR